MIVDPTQASGVTSAELENIRGTVTLSTIIEVIDEAGTLAANAPSMGQEELAGAVAALADQVRQLAGEVYQIARGAQHARLLVDIGDD